MVKKFRESKDAAVMTVIVEDAAALLGLLIAVVALLLSDISGNMVYDSIGSLIIGLELMTFAIFLAK
jgi:hypothetical protein